MRKYLVVNDAREVVAQLIEGVHDIPESAVLIDGDRWYEVTQDIGCTWLLSEDGELSKRPKLAVAEDPIGLEREWRNQVLAATEWLVTRHRDEQELDRETTITTEQYAQLLAYRQDLRDWPQASEFPDGQQRPNPPAWFAEQTQ